MSPNIPGPFASLAAIAVALASTGAAAQDIEPRPVLRPALRPSLQVEEAQIRPEILATEIVPPADLEAYDDPQSVTLRTGASSQVMSSLQVVRRFDLETLRRNPQIQLGEVRTDMRPVLQNPQSPANVASRLRDAPGVAQDVRDAMEVIETDRGLLVRQFLSYRMVPGACSDRVRRMALTRVGASCFTRMSDEQRAAERADPASSRFAGGSLQRPDRTLPARREEQQREIADDIASLRTMLEDPVQRAAIEREIGADAAARYARLTDEQLEAELVNAGEIQIEEVMFLPTRQRPQLALAGLAQLQMAQPGLATRALFVPQPVETVTAQHDVSDRVFLAGFTLGRENEWRKRVSITISWCVVGCKKTYYIEANAGFTYDFGLRLPLEVGGTYNFDDGRATFTADFHPINGSIADFESTALPADQVLEGKELVAQVGAHAGFAYKIPAIGSSSVGASVSHDFTEGLPAPFANGQFTPPAAGQSTPPAEHVFRNIDLLGGRANFWFAGATVHPSVKVSMVSDRLELTLTDNLADRDYTISQPGQRFDLEVDPIGNASSFTIGDPVYNIGFELTPGVTAIAFVDVALWRHEWPWDVWFPQMTISLPPDGKDFTCHAQTICGRTYNYSPDVQEEEDEDPTPPATEPERLIWQWQRDFRAEWLPRCPDQSVKFCEVAINWTAQKYGYRMEEAIPAAYHQDVVNLDLLNAPEARSIFESLRAQANAEAFAIIEDSEEIP